jgi:hypothetical protein
MQVRVLLTSVSLSWAATKAPAQSPSPLPKAPGARVATITPPGRTGSEPSIAVNFFSPNQVAAGGGAWVAYSADSGRTFTAVQPGAVGGKTGGDPSLVFDDKGTLFLGILWIQKNGLPGYWGHGPGANGIYLRRSPDGGKTWEHETVPIMEWKGDEPEVRLEDMPRLWADVQPTSPYKGNLYAAWIEWQLTQSIVLFSRSTDGGKTWSKPMRVSTKAGLPRDDNGAVVGIIGTVAPDGTQYVVWNEGLNVTLAISRDGGKSFEPSRPIFDVGPPYFGGASGIPGVSRAMGFPQIGLDPKSGALLVTWSDFRNGDVDVFIARSLDRGRTWTSPSRVNDDPVHSGADQFLQWMAVDPKDGSVYVQFYDRRADPENRKTWVTLARSTDGGKTFANYQWSEEPSVGENAFLGDYEWLTAYDGRVYGVWAEAAPDGYELATRPEGARPLEKPRTPTILKVGTADFNPQR